MHAAAVRTPQRIAVVEGERALSYVTLMNLVDEGKTGSSRVIEWLIAELVRETAEESPRHRALLLRALDNVVEHAVFDRDGVTASALPLSTPLGAVAATVSLVLGGTLHFVERDGLWEGAVAGRFQTVWVNPGDLVEDLPNPAPGFRLALCNGPPSPRLTQWLGLRVVQAV